MNGDGDAPLSDRRQILQIFEGLAAGQGEFPIKVEGTHTLPYAATVVKLSPEAPELILKLIRPLPHELALGALFEVVFPCGEQRFTGLLTYQGRHAYLHYRFTLPAMLRLSDRRRHKRHPFRPREKVDVLIQDGSVPGHGVAGPLVNLSEGGLLLRVDRILRLGDGLRIPPSTSFFERGKALPLVRVRNLPRCPILQVRGVVAHCDERNGEVVVGVQFLELEGGEAQILQQVLEVRERSFRSLPPSGGATERATAAPSPVEAPRAASPETPADGSPDPSETFRLLLARRCRDLLLVMSPGPGREDLLERLRSLGFLRIQTLDGPEALATLNPPLPGLPSPLVLRGLDGDSEVLAQVRDFQKRAGPWSDCPTLFLAGEADPVASLAEEAGWRVAGLPSEGDQAWIHTLDSLGGMN
ncbi:MAG: PilZ domain-containing protein [Acidobacteria bacterium]|nr:PilZ domain-containing protein [Acidobacteriota bacterium]